MGSCVSITEDLEVGALALLICTEGSPQVVPTLWSRA